MAREREPNRISFTLAPGPKRTPEQQKAFEMVITNAADRARRRCHQNMDFSHLLEPECVTKRLDSLDASELRVLLKGDLQNAEEEKGGDRAFAAEAYFEQKLGIHPVIPIEGVKQLNLHSKMLVRDVLALAKTTYQDVGFRFNDVNVDDFHLRAVQKALGVPASTEEE